MKENRGPFGKRKRLIWKEIKWEYKRDRVPRSGKKERITELHTKKKGEKETIGQGTPEKRDQKGGKKASGRVG